VSFVVKILALSAFSAVHILPAAKTESLNPKCCKINTIH